MAITAIRAVRNLLLNDVYFVRNQEQPNDTGGKGHALEVDPGAVLTCNMWIPWCRSQEDFDWHHKIIVVPVVNDQIPVVFNIWQEGDYVRYSRDGLFKSNGDLVPGNCTVGGDRSVEIVGDDAFNADLRFF